ncbi:MAG: DNA internalization-related competence protein ComEC/Rec2 [Gemmatimonadota bacterium]
MAPLVTAVAWLAAGLAVGLPRSAPDGSGPFLVLVACAAAAGAIRAARGLPGGGTAGGGRSVLALMALAGVLLGLGARTRVDRSCRHWIPADVPVHLRGTVVQAAMGARDDIRITVAAERVAVGGVRVSCHGEVPARTEGSRPPEPGEVLVATGRWWSPPGAGSSFVRPGLFMVDSLEVVAARRRPPVLDRLRRAVRERIDALYPRHAPLVASLLLARREGLDREVRDRYARAGLSHLLAISGLHVGLVAGVLLLLAGSLRAGKGTAAAVAAVGTSAYGLFLGAPHSAARAALQIVLLLVARSLQRPTRTEALIAAAALALLALDPAALLQPGFQLSFAGGSGILVMRGPLLEGLGAVAGVRVGRMPIGRWLADGLATSVAATVVTAPIVAWHFGRVAPVGVVANLVAIPLLGAAVPALAGSVAVSALAPSVGRFLAGGAGVLLDGLGRTASVAAAVPGGTVAVPASVAFSLTAAVAVGWLLSRRLGRVRRRVRALAWAGVGAAVLLVAPLRPSGDRVEVHMIDVGQGDAIALRSPAGRWLLVDAGVATEGYDAGAARVVPYLSRRGVTRLEALVLTQPDADHTGGAGSVLAALRPRWAGDPGAVAGKSPYLALLRRASADRVPWVALHRGVEIELDGMRMAVLFPAGPGGEVEDANDASVVVRVEYGAFAALLTGDAPAAVEQALVRQYGERLDADVLKVGHHGSATSTTLELLRATGARHALISAGRGNRYGHPHASVLRRLRGEGIRIYRTDRQGSVVVKGRADGRVTVGVETGRVPGAARIVDPPGEGGDA